MEWLWSIITALGGWWLGHRQSSQDRKRGVKEGAEDAFDMMEIALVGGILVTSTSMTIVYLLQVRG